jgi:hypothetical protein
MELVDQALMLSTLPYRGARMRGTPRAPDQTFAHSRFHAVPFLVKRQAWATGCTAAVSFPPARKTDPIVWPPPLPLRTAAIAITPSSKIIAFRRGSHWPFPSPFVTGLRLPLQSGAGARIVLTYL